jgi:hypothetical protein
MLKPTGEATCTEGQRTARRDREAAGDVPTTHEHTSGDPLPLGVAARPLATGVLPPLKVWPLVPMKMLAVPTPLVPMPLVPLPPHHPRMMLRRPCRAAALREDEATPLQRRDGVRVGMPRPSLMVRRVGQTTMVF